MVSDPKLEKVRNIYSFWGKFSFLYDAQDFVTFLGKAGKIRNRAVEELKLSSGDKVLEVACGSGRNFSYLTEAVGKNGRVVGFDYSQEMLDAAKRLCRKNKFENVKLVQGDAAELEIDFENFDGVLSVLGISAVPEWEKALKRSYEVLCQGGRLVVCDACLFSGFLRVLNPLVRFVYSKFAAWDPSKNIPEKMKEIFGNVEVDKFNFGTFFIAVAVKCAKLE